MNFFNKRLYIIFYNLFMIKCLNRRLGVWKLGEESSDEYIARDLL